VIRYQKGKANLDFTESRDGEWQWHQLGYMKVLHLAPDRQYNTIQYNTKYVKRHVAVASGALANRTVKKHRQPCQHPTTQFLQAECRSCRPTNSVKALKASVGL